MKINYDDFGNILAAGRGIYGVEVDAAIPDDFHQTFSIGKYKFIGGAIVETVGWTMPILTLQVI